MINGTFFSVPWREKSRGRMVVKGNAFFPVDNSSLRHPQGVGFRGAGTGMPELKTLEIFPHFTERPRPGKWAGLTADEA